MLRKRPHDHTGRQRMADRRKRLHAIAIAAGFPSWSALETAALNGQPITIPGANQ